jgi:hypothetical protein
MQGRWLDLDGVVNARVLGDGLVRADNLQDLSEADVRVLVERERVGLVWTCARSTRWPPRVPAR